MPLDVPRSLSMDLLFYVVKLSVGKAVRGKAKEQGKKNLFEVFQGLKNLRANFRDLRFISVFNKYNPNASC